MHLNTTQVLQQEADSKILHFASHFPEGIGAKEGMSNSEIEGSVPSGFYFGVCYFT